MSSTQTYLSEMLEKNTLPEGTLVHALEQTGGRGLADNKWESHKGENLTFSFLWYPSFLLADQQFRMNKAIALAVHDFVITKTDEGIVRIKWPNDIYIRNKKVAGILIENSIMNGWFRHSIIGIGININQDMFSETLPDATSLKIETGHVFDLNTCLREICLFLDIRYNQLKSKIRGIDSDYINRLYRFGLISKYRYKGSFIKASITGISPYGQLILQDESGETLTCDMKEIEFLQ